MLKYRFHSRFETTRHNLVSVFYAKRFYSKADSSYGCKKGKNYETNPARSICRHTHFNR